MSMVGDRDQGRRLFDAAHRLRRLERRVSAYHLIRNGMRLGTPTKADAQLGLWLAARFADAPFFEALRQVVDSGTGETTDGLKRAEIALNQIMPFDVNTARGLLEVRSPRAFEPIEGRICYALSSSLPLTSGYATRAQGMAEGMRNAGLDIVGLTRPGFPWDRGGADNAADLEEETSGDIIYRRIRLPQRRGMNQRDYIEQSISAWAEAIARIRPMAVLAASNWESALPAGAAARRLGIPFLYEVRGFWEMTRASKEEGFETTPLYAGWSQLEAVTAAGADHVFTLTEPMREELALRGVPVDRITLLPNACHPDEFTTRPRDAALAAQIGLPQTVPVIGYVGSFVGYEGLELLIEACALLRTAGKQFRLLLVGSESGGVGSYSASLRKLAERQGLADWLIMPGRVPYEQVPHWYSLIDIAPFPRMPHAVTERVSPLKPMEAMAMRKAVIVSDLRALCEIVRQDETGLIFRRADAGDLSAVLGRLLSDPELRRRMGENARRFIETERAWNFVGRRASEIIKAVTGSAA